MQESHSSTTDWFPSCDLGILRQRAEFQTELRCFFAEHHFLEVETPLLSQDTVVDANLDPIVAEFRADRGASVQRFFLQTSPEFAMKRLLAAGETAIFQIARAFRNGEAGQLHNPEFTMIEWYRTGETHREQMELTERLVRRLWQPGKNPSLALSKSPFRILTYDEAFERATGQRVLRMVPERLLALSRQLKIELPRGLMPDDRDGLLNLILAEIVEPTLGQDQPEFLVDYPASQAALAIVREDDDTPVAERFELYWQGIELCNGYHELTDPDEFRRRMSAENGKRQSEGAEKLPEQNRLYDAMVAGLPPCAGVALGFDRLVMFLTGRKSLAEVLPFPLPRA